MKKAILAVVAVTGLYASFAFANCPPPTYITCEGMPQRCSCR